MTVPKVPDLSLGPRDTVAIEVAHNLLRYLLSGDLQPGDRLPPERALAESAGVGRSAIREAIKSLSLLGLIDVRQGDGTYFRSPESDLLPKVIEWGLLLGEKRVLDLVEARKYIEIAVAGLAADRRTDEALSVLQRHIDDMAKSDLDTERFEQADIAFHTELAKAAGNSTFQGVLSSLHGLLHVWISRVIEHATDFRPFVEEHARILDAVVRQDVESATAAMAAHMDTAIVGLSAALVRQPESEDRPPARTPTASAS